MKKWLKKGSAVLLAVAMALTLFAGINITTLTAYAAPNTAPTLNINTDGSVYLQEDSGSLQYSRNDASWTNYEGICTITGDGTTTINKIIVKSGSHTIKLKDVNIDVSVDKDSCAFDIQSGAGDVTVELEGTNTLKSSDNRAGIEKNSDDSKRLTITSAAGNGKTDGSLAATSTDGAGIGGGNGDDGHDAQNGYNGGNGENIIINGGTVTATSTDGAGIGGGKGGTGGNGATWIGLRRGGKGGNGGNGRNIIINGGTIIATSTYGAGIGGGNGGNGGNGENGGEGGNGGNGENIIINGGTVTATGGTAGIGGGNGGNGGTSEGIGGTGGNVGSAGSQSDIKIIATADCKANAWVGENKNNTKQLLTDLTTTYTIADAEMAKYMKIVMVAGTSGGGSTGGGGSSSGGGGTGGGGGSSSGTVATPETKIDPADAQSNLFGMASTIDVTGKERSETSMLLADQVKKALGVEKFSTIILASGTDFPDGLGVSALSIQQKAPVLIVTSSTEAAIKKYIEENLVSDGKVIISGGAGAVSQNMQNSLKGINVTRLGGADRYKTNILTIKELLAKGAGKDEVLIASGKDFADALSASATGKIIMIVGDKLTDEQKALLKETGFGKITILGGTGAVSGSIENELNAVTGKKADRVGGANRIETSKLIAARYFPGSTTSVYTKANGFADGLAGGLLANITGSPMRLSYGAGDMTESGKSVTLGGIR